MIVGTIVAFIFGCIVGSFLNVVILRTEKKEQFLSGRSHCMHCQHTLSFWDLIPVVSYIALGGKCRYCKARLSAQYPIVEALTGVLFAVGFWFAAPVFLPHSVLLFALVMLYYMVAVSMMIVMSFYDFRTLTIPNAFITFSVFSALVFDFLLIFFPKPAAAASYWFSFPSFNFFSSIEGAVIAALFMLFLYLVTMGNSMGFGDIKLVVFLGLLLGWPNILLMIFASFVLGAVTGIILLIFRLKHLQSKLPFAPFLAAGSLLTIFLANLVFYGYLHGFF